MTNRGVDVPATTRQALDVLSLLTGKWQPAVLAVLSHRERTGFNDLMAALPDISGKVLSDTLDALQDAGLVDRQVVSESPLRVEYELTDAGADLTDVFDELAAWGDEHLDTATPTVLVAENDRRITDMYRGWLTDRFTVIRAHDRTELEAGLIEDIDVALYPRRLTDTDPEAVAESAPQSCRTVLLIDGQPDVDILDIDCDDVLTKPLVRESMLTAMERQLSQQGDPPQVREQSALDRKLTVLEETHTPEELQTRDRYVAARNRLDELTH